MEPTLFTVTARKEKDQETAKRLEKAVNTQPLNGILMDAVRESIEEMFQRMFWGDNWENYSETLDG